MAKYTIFGGGPGGLYTAWRLLSGAGLTNNDTVEIIEWGNYDYENNGDGDRTAAGRICSYHFDKDPNQSYIEVGGMRYIEWNPGTKEGHQLVTKTITAMDLDDQVIEFNTTDNPLLFLRGEHIYQEDLGTEVNGQLVLAPYNTPGNNAKPASDLFSHISGLITDGYDVSTRAQQCEFYANGVLSNSFNSFVYSSGDNTGNIGYWNVFYDQAGNEGFQYAADAGGYSSNVINWNAANAAVYNGEFAPGGAFKTLRTGYSSLFVELYKQCVALAQSYNIQFSLQKNTRLHSIWLDTEMTQYRTANADEPNKANSAVQTTDYAFLAMPPHAIELIAAATRYLPDQGNVVDFLNATNVQNYLQSVIVQPSFKVAMFFDTPWWEDSDKVKYPPKLINQAHNNVNVFGPTVTDIPLRQVYYFGDNAPNSEYAGQTYGMLASYDDMRFTKFWEEMTLSVNDREEVPRTQNFQPLQGAGDASNTMEKMLLLQLAKVHWGDPNAAYQIPTPKQTVYMDWGLNPFGGGYHAWNAHYNICDVMQTIRTPGRLAGVENSNIFLIGSAFSNDQAWVEGAFCTAESVLVDFLNITTIADTDGYPLICGCS